MIYELDSQHFGFLDSDPQKYADPRIRIHEAKHQPNAVIKTFFSRKTEIWIFN